MNQNFLGAALIAIMLLPACGGGEEPVTDPAATSQAAVPVIAQSQDLILKASTSDPSPLLSDEARVLLRNSHVATWAYFVSNGRWYIAQSAPGKHDVYSLGPLENGNAAWWRAGTTSTAVDNAAQTATTDPGLQAWYSTNAFLSRTGDTSTTKYDARIVADRERIQGTTVPVAWYFFNAPNGAWYIVNSRHWAPSVLRFGAKADNSDYDWRKIDLAGAYSVLQPTAQGMAVTFKSRLIFPLVMPTNATLASPDNAIYNTNGFSFLQDTGTTYAACTSSTRVTRHPGLDINAYGKSGDQDDGDAVLAIYDGIVRGRHDAGGGLTVEHVLADGTRFWTAHRHMRNIAVQEGQTVRRGQTVGLVSNVGADHAHLHFEIRSAQHPDPANANYWCGYANQSDATLRSWLLDPMAFLRANQ